jgi:hypothetical protein
MRMHNKRWHNLNVIAIAFACMSSDWRIYLTHSLSLPPPWMFSQTGLKKKVFLGHDSMSGGDCRNFLGERRSVSGAVEWGFMNPHAITFITSETDTETPLCNKITLRTHTTMWARVHMYVYAPSHTYSHTCLHVHTHFNSNFSTYFYFF